MNHPSRATGAFFLSLLMTACGGGGGGGGSAPPADTTAPTSAITSPADGFATFAATVTVSGTASDDTGVTSVTVNGVAATGTTTWSIEVPLTVGANTITAVARDAAGNQQNPGASISVTRREDTRAPTAAIVFPPADGATSGTSVTVTGTASDDNAITELSVGGVAATTTDGYANWRVSVPLVAGQNNLVVRVADESGRTVESAATRVVRQTAEPMQTPTDVVVDADRDRVLVIDSSADAVFAVSRTDGSRSVVSSARVGSGQRFIQPLTGTIRSGEAALYVADNAWPALIRVDLVTGDRTVVSGLGVGSGPALSNIVGIAYDTLTDRFVLSTSGAVIYLVDRATGARTEVTGREFEELAEDPARHRVLGAFGSTLYAINPADGSNSVLSASGTRGTGVTLSTITDIAMSPRGNDVVLLARTTVGGVTTTQPGIVLVDPVSGDRRTQAFTGSATDTGFGGVDSMTVDSALSRIYMTDFDPPRVLRVDVSDAAGLGDRTVVSDSSASAAGSGPDLRIGIYMTVDPTSGRAFVYDTAARAIYRVDISSGARSLFIGDSFGVGAPTPNISGIAFDSARSRVIAHDASGARYLSVAVADGTTSVLRTRDSTNPSDYPFTNIDISYDSTTGRVVGATSSLQLFELDAVSGAWSVLASSTDGGTGPALANLSVVQRLTATELAVLLRNGTTAVPSLLAVDTNTKARREIWAGPADTPTSPTGLVLTGSTTAYVLDWWSGTVTRVNLATGTGTTVASAGVGQGPVAAWEDLSMDASGTILYANDRHGIYAIDIQSGDRVIISR